MEFSKIFLGRIACVIRHIIGIGAGFAGDFLRRIQDVLDVGSDLFRYGVSYPVINGRDEYHSEVRSIRRFQIFLHVRYDIPGYSVFTDGHPVVRSDEVVSAFHGDADRFLELVFERGIAGQLVYDAFRFQDNPLRNVGKKYDVVSAP